MNKQTELDRTAIALSHEQNPAQLMLDFDDFYYVIYNRTQTESLRRAIVTNKLLTTYGQSQSRYTDAIAKRIHMQRN